jgi:DNA (cytosine-5)-methyltransferase 1
LNGLDLFSGIGGLSEALAPWVRPIAYCENDRATQSMLLSRMARGELFLAPIWGDVRTLSRSAVDSLDVDIIYGGFPCQDISAAGYGAGLDGVHSGLFFEISRLVHEIRPPFVFLENVPAITTRGLDRVAAEFSKLRYDCRWAIVSAAELGAAHVRKRWFLLAADPDSVAKWIEPRRGQGARWEGQTLNRAAVENGEIADPDGSRMEIGWPRVGYGEEKPFSVELLEGNDWNERAAFFLRVDHGLPYRSHRLRAMGNSVVPIQARAAFKKLIGISGDVK